MTFQSAPKRTSTIPLWCILSCASVFTFTARASTLADRAHVQECWCCQLQGRVDRAWASYRAASEWAEVDVCTQWQSTAHCLFKRWQRAVRRLAREVRVLAKMTWRVWPWTL